MINFTQEFNLAKNIELILQDNVLAVLSKENLKVISSAAYNGGFREASAILNVGVPEGYSINQLHTDPMPLIMASSDKIGIKGNFVCMVTAVKVSNFSLAQMEGDGFSVSVAATGGCTNAETAGENLSDQLIPSTINIIVVVDGNPTESSQVSLMITVTEAKTAALNRLDIRSAYSGDLATGTTTDTIVVASTNRGSLIEYGGPSSKLGQAVSKCVQIAVTGAILKQENRTSSRTIFDRLRERGLSMEKIAEELAKIKSLNADKGTILSELSQILKSNPVLSFAILESTRMSWDFDKGLIPLEFGQIESLTVELEFHSYVLRNGFLPKNAYRSIPKHELEKANLPIPLKNVLVGLLRKSI